MVWGLVFWGFGPVSGLGLGRVSGLKVWGLGLGVGSSEGLVFSSGFGVGVGVDHPPTHPPTQPPAHPTTHPRPPNPTPTQHSPLNFTTALKIFGEFFKKFSKFTNPPS